MFGNEKKLGGEEGRKKWERRENKQKMSGFLEEKK